MLGEFDAGLLTGGANVGDDVEFVLASLGPGFDGEFSFFGGKKVGFTGGPGDENAGDVVLNE